MSWIVLQTLIDAQVAQVDDTVSKEWGDFIIPILSFAFLILNELESLLCESGKQWHHFGSWDFA